MKAVILFIFSGLLASSVNAQAKGDPQLLQAKSFSMPPAESSAQQQADAWAEETQNNPQNANAWLNYALWTQRNTTLSATQKQAQLNQIGAEAEKNIPTTGERQLIRFLQSNKTDSAAIEAALSKINDRVLVYPFAIQSAIIRQNKSQLILYCNAFNGWQNLNWQAPLYRYHANVLRSAPDSAIIFAMGENDLVPMAMLQHTAGIRPDVRLMYYTPALAQQHKNAYLCLSLGENILQQYANAGFHGLLLDISGKSKSGTPENILPKGIDFDYITGNTFTGLVAQLHNNYLPSLLLAYRYYKKNNAGEAEKYKTLIQKIAREGGKADTILPLLDKQ